MQGVRILSEMEFGQDHSRAYASTMAPFLL